MTRQMTVQGAATMIARARSDAGLSQRYIAQALGVSERTVKKLGSRQQLAEHLAADRLVQSLRREPRALCA